MSIESELLNLSEQSARTSADKIARLEKELAAKDADLNGATILIDVAIKCFKQVATERDTLKAELVEANDIAQRLKEVANECVILKARLAIAEKAVAWVKSLKHHASLCIVDLKPNSDCTCGLSTLQTELRKTRE